MRSRAFALLVAILVAAHGALAEDPAHSAPESAQEQVAALPPVSAPPPFPIDPTKELLPPGIRVREKRAPVSDLSPRGRLVRERIDDPSASRRIEVEYTVDSALDERVREVLKVGRVPLGHVILMDPDTGEIYSYVSTDPETFPATRAYPTASLMKVVTAAAVLRNAPAAAGRDCRYVGNPYELRAPFLKAPARGGRVDSFWRAIAISNNQCFARLAIEDVGEEALVDEMNNVGLLDPPGARHAAGRVEPIGGALDLGYLGSGLAGSFVTPLAAVRLAALLNNGELVTPYWVAHVRDEDGQHLWAPERRAPRSVWPAELARELREHLIAVTTEGTARRAFRDRRGKPLLGSIEVSGKTGTLSGSNPNGKYQWFIGVAPADDPLIAIATVVVRDGSGGINASEVAAATLRKIFCRSEGCHPSLGMRLHARAEERDALVAEERAERARQRRAIEAAELAKIYEVDELDEIPRPVGETNIDFPSRLLQRRVRGRVVLSVLLSREGEIAEVEIESSDLPRFDPFVLEQVKEWKFTPPLNRGRPVQARSLVPVPIIVN